MLSSILRTNIINSLYLHLQYMSTNVIFSADGTLTSMDIDPEYIASNL